MVGYVEFGSPINDYCEATSWSIGGNGNSVAGGSAFRAQLHGLSFTKAVDSLSAALFQNCAAGRNFGQVTLELYKDDDSDPYLVYVMKDVVISSVQTGGGGGESVSLDFKSVSITYFK